MQAHRPLIGSKMPASIHDPRFSLPMWPNTNEAKAYGTMVAVKTDSTVNLIVGKRYHILELDPSAIGPGIAEFDYLVKDENEHFVWVDKTYLTDFVAR